MKARTLMRRLAGGLAAVGLVFTAGCAGAGTLGATDQTVTIAMVSNSQMTDARELSSKFEEANPDIKLRFVTLSENQARAKITASTAMGGGEFDVVMISNYETRSGPRTAGWSTSPTTPARHRVTTRTTSSRRCANRCPTTATCTRCRSTVNRRS